MMKFSTCVLSAGLALALCTQARAVKILERLSPASAPQEGFTISTKEREDGTLRFTVTRDIAKARWHGRDATLEVRGEGGPIVVCRLEPGRDRQKNTVTYWFDLAKGRVASSVLTVAEIQTEDGREDGEKLVGGGTFYELHLGDFVRK